MWLMSSDIKPYIKKKMWVHIKVKVATKNALFSLKVAPLCNILLVDADVLIEESLDTKFCVYPKFFACGQVLCGRGVLFWVSSFVWMRSVMWNSIFVWSSILFWTFEFCWDVVCVEVTIFNNIFLKFLYFTLLLIAN